MPRHPQQITQWIVWDRAREFAVRRMVLMWSDYNNVGIYTRKIALGVRPYWQLWNNGKEKYYFRQEQFFLQDLNGEMYQKHNRKTNERSAWESVKRI